MQSIYESSDGDMQLNGDVYVSGSGWKTDGDGQGEGEGEDGSEAYSYTNRPDTYIHSGYYFPHTLDTNTSSRLRT